MGDNMAVSAFGLVLDAKIVQGTDVSLSITAVNNANLPIDLTVMQDIKWRLVRQYGDSVVLLKTLLTGGIILTATTGIFEIPLNATETDLLVGDYIHEADLINQAGQIIPVTLCNLNPGILTVRAAL